MQCNAMMVRLFSFWYVLIRTMNACKFSRFSFRATFCHVSLYAKEPLYPYCKICITLFTGTLRSLLSVNKSYYFQSLVKQQTASIQGLVLFFFNLLNENANAKTSEGNVSHNCNVQESPWNLANRWDHGILERARPLRSRAQYHRVSISLFCF